MIGLDQYILHFHQWAATWNLHTSSIVVRRKSATCQIVRNAPSLKPSPRVEIVDAFAPTLERGTPPSLLCCELAVVGYREIAFYPLTGGNAYPAIFAPPSDESHIRFGVMIACTQ